MLIIMLIGGPRSFGSGTLLGSAVPDHVTSVTPERAPCSRADLRDVPGLGRSGRDARKSIALKNPKSREGKSEPRMARDGADGGGRTRTGIAREILSLLRTVSGGFPTY